MLRNCLGTLGGDWVKILIAPYEIMEDARVEFRKKVDDKTPKGIYFSFIMKKKATGYARG